MRSPCRIDQACLGQAAASGKPGKQFWTAPGNYHEGELKRVKTINRKILHAKYKSPCLVGKDKPQSFPMEHSESC